MDTLVPVIVGGIIGSLGPLVALIIQGRQNREIRQEQRKEAQEARVHEAHEAKNERVRQACVDLLGALLTFEVIIPEVNAIARVFDEDEDFMKTEGAHQAATLRGALLSMDNARRTLLLYTSEDAAMSFDERLTFQVVTTVIEYDLSRFRLFYSDNWEDKMLATITRLKQVLPEVISKL